ILHCKQYRRWVSVWNDRHENWQEGGERMTVIDILTIGVGGFLGAVIRYFISGKINKDGRALPFGTLFVNIAGSLLIGFVAGLGVTKPWTLFLVSGFAGAFTTFSTLTK